MLHHYITAQKQTQLSRVCYLRLFDVFLASREFPFRTYFTFTAAGVVACGGRKRSPLTSSYCRLYILWSFGIIGRCVIAVLMNISRFKTPFHLYCVYLYFLNSKIYNYFLMYLICFLFSVLFIISFILADNKTKTAFQFLSSDEF